MKALVTGGAGFIGSHLVDRLITEGWKVKVIDNLSSGYRENVNKKAELIIGDLKDPKIALKAVEDVDVVFHFAANPEVRVSTTNPKIHFENNIVVTFNILEAMRIKDVKEIIFASSSSIYGEPEVIPVSEDAPMRPVSVYGASKAACENLIHAYTKLYGFKAIILRYANVVDPRLRHGVIYDFILKLKKNPSKLEILGDGTQLRSFIHIEDAIEATMIALEKSHEPFSVYNIASEDWITIKEVADIVCETMGLKPLYQYKPVFYGIGWLGDVKRIALDIKRIKKLGFNPKFNSRQAVKETTKALLKELNNI